MASVSSCSGRGHSGHKSHRKNQKPEPGNRTKAAKYRRSLDGLPKTSEPEFFVCFVPFCSNVFNFHVVELVDGSKDLSCWEQIGLEQKDAKATKLRQETQERRKNHRIQKPFIGTLRVRIPPGRAGTSPGAAGKASLAWWRVTSTSRRRQLDQMPCD